MTSNQNSPSAPGRSGRLRPFVLLVAAAVAFSSCECEEKVRKMVSNPGKRTFPEADSGETSSRPSETEPNNVRDKATPVTLAGELRPVEGTLETTADVDWFELRIEEEEPWLVVFDVRPSSDLDVSLHVDLGDADRVPLTYNNGSAGESESIPVLRVDRDGVLLALKSESGTRGDYELHFKKRLAGGMVDAEPNDDASVANEWQAPSEVSGRYDRPDDRDVYRITGKKPHVFEFRATPLPGTPQTIRFFSEPPLVEPLMSIQIPAGTKSGIVPNVRIDPESDGLLVVATATTESVPEDGYRIRFAPFPPTEGPIEVEPNDTEGQDVERPVTLKGFLHSPDDVDRFVVDPPDEDDDGAGAAEVEPEDEIPEPGSDDEARDAGHVAEKQDAGSPTPMERLKAIDTKEKPEGRAIVRLTPLHEELSAGLTLEPHDGEPMVMKPVDTGKPVEICGEVIAPGDIVEVRPMTYPANLPPGVPHYELSIEPLDDGGEFEVEPNDTMGDADPIVDARRRGFSAEEADVDVFAFAVPGGGPRGTSHLNLTLQGKELDYAIELLDSEGGLVGNFDQAGHGAGERISLDLPEGLYYAVVRSKGRGSCQPYEIGVTTGGGR